MEEGKRVIQRDSAVRKRDDGTSPWAKVRGGGQDVVHSNRHEHGLMNTDKAPPISTLTLGHHVRQEVAWQDDTKKRERN